MRATGAFLDLAGFEQLDFRSHPVVQIDDEQQIAFMARLFRRDMDMLLHRRIRARRVDRELTGLDLDAGSC